MKLTTKQIEMLQKFAAAGTIAGTIANKMDYRTLSALRTKGLVLRTLLGVCPVKDTNITEWSITEEGRAALLTA